MENFLNEIVCPIDIEWKLNKEDLMELTDYPGEYLVGEYFSANNIAGIRYYLKLFPNGFGEDGDGHTWIFLNIDDLEERNNNAEITVSTEYANFSDTFNILYDDEMRHGMYICKTSEFYDSLKKFFTDGEITIKVNGIFKTKYPSIPKIVCPIDTEWKFKKADFMDLMDSKNESLKGKYFCAFNIPGLRYNIEIYPNGDNKKHHGETWILFHTEVFRERYINVDLQIIVESANASESVKYIFTNHTRRGAKMCKMDEFFDSKSKYFVNGEIKIKVKGILKTSIFSKSKVCSQLSLQWKIKEAVLKETVEEGKKYMRLRSDVKKDASFSDTSYYLSIGPNEMTDENHSEAIVYLNVDFKRFECIGAVFDNSGENAVFTNYFFHGCSGRCELKTILCSTEDLFDPTKGFIVNGYLTLNVSGILIKEEDDHFVTLNCKNGVSSKFAFEMDDKDFLLVVGEEEIQVHKQVLMEVSPVFAEMLESETKESIIENKMYITNFTFTTVDAAIKLCYGINVSLKYSLENLLALYKFGHEYRIELIMDLIEDYLINQISPSNVVYLIKFSAPDSFNIKKLYQKCIDFMIKCSKESIPIYASESLGDNFLAAMVLKTFLSKS